jgi:hypothetical protein
VSGVAASVTHPGVYWTHNDAGSVLFAIDGQGTVLGRFRLQRRVQDWEDVAVGSCPEGGSCLYMADLGDNYEERTNLRIVRAHEPVPTQSGPLAVETFPVVLPDGPRDIEALIVLPGERILVVTKGRNHPVTVYRYPGALRPEATVLEEVQRLSETARIFPRQVTGGTSTPAGDVAALRTYGSLQFYSVRGDTLIPADSGFVDLRGLGESQGEGVGIAGDGMVLLTSEGGPGGGPGSISTLRCHWVGM